MSFRRPLSLTLLPAIAAGTLVFSSDRTVWAEEPAKPAETAAPSTAERPSSEDRLSQLQQQGAEKMLSRQASGAADLMMIPAGEGRPDPETRLLLAQNSNQPAADASASAQPSPPAAPPSDAPNSNAPAPPQGPNGAPAPGGPQGQGAGGGPDGATDGGQRRGFGPPGGGFGGGFPSGGGFGGGGFGGRGFRRGGGEGGPPGAVGADGTESIRIEGDRVALQFPNNPVADILSIYEMLTGITLVKDTGIFEGATISLVTPKSVTKDEAIKLIEAALLTNGYAIVMDPGGKSARILPARTQNANAIQFSHGVQFYQSAKDLPDGETLVTYFMKLDHLAAEEAGQILANHVGLSVYGRITPVATPPGLLITESATIVKQLISIHDAIDVPDTGSSLITKFLPLTYGDAATIAQIVQATVNAQAQERETKGLTTLRGSPISGSERESSRSSSSPPPTPSSSSRSSSSSQQQAVMPSSQVVADTRLNQILVVASPEDFAYISSLIAEFDKPLTVEAPYERLLKYASAVDVLPAVVDVLKEATGGAVQLPGGGTLAVQSGQPTLSTSSTQLLAGRQTQGTRGGTVSSSLTGGGSTDSTTGTSSTGLGNRPDVIQGPQEDNAPVSVLIGKTRIIADPMANAILVMGRKEETQKVDQLLDKLDRKPAQVYLATVIGQLTLGDDFQFGVDYLTKFGNQDGRRGTASFFASREDVITNNNITDLRDNLITSAFGPAKGFNVYGQIGDSVEAFVTALESTNKFKVLSRPSVFALNNKKATITSGQKIPYPQTTTTFANNTNGNTTSTTDYLDVVLKLEVVPLINADGEVNLTIAQVNDTVVGTQRIEPNDIPIIGTEQLITAVTVPNGNTVVLGGLISEEKKKDTEGIPYISRVPLLGNLFKENINSKTRKELIIFIQPIVVTDNNSLKQASYGEDIRTNIGKDAAERFPTVPEPPKEQLEQKDKKKGFFSRLFNKSKKESEE